MKLGPRPKPLPEWAEKAYRSVVLGNWTVRDTADAYAVSKDTVKRVVIALGKQKWPAISTLKGLRAIEHDVASRRYSQQVLRAEFQAELARQPAISLKYTTRATLREIDYGHGQNLTIEVHRTDARRSMETRVFVELDRDAYPAVTVRKLRLLADRLEAASITYDRHFHETAAATADVMISLGGSNQNEELYQRENCEG